MAEEGGVGGNVDEDEWDNFEVAYRAAYRPVLQFLRRRLPPGDAEDAAAEVFTVAWRRWGTGAGRLCRGSTESPERSLRTTDAPPVGLKNWGNVWRLRRPKVRRRRPRTTRLIASARREPWPGCRRPTVRFCCWCRGTDWMWATPPRSWDAAVRRSPSNCTVPGCDWSECWPTSTGHRCGSSLWQRRGEGDEPRRGGSQSAVASRR